MLRCVALRGIAPSAAPMVRLLMKTIQDRGCKVPSSGFFECAVLDAPVLGAFDADQRKVATLRPVVCTPPLMQSFVV